VRAFRFALHSYREFYDRIWWMLLVTALWWLMLPTIVFVPPATLLLFRHADPRIGIWHDRPSLRESGQFLWSQLTRGWVITLVTLPIVALTVFNLVFYGGEDGGLAVLAPVWLVLVILSITAAFLIFAVAGVTDLSAKAAIVTGARLTAARLPAALVVIFLTVLVPILVITSTFYILLPVALMIPGLVATALSAFVLEATGTPIPDPNKPTDERLHEKHSG
jgi:hypothetical protein